MFDVLLYVYENYWRPDACPDHDQLTRKLCAVGFENEDIEDALAWLDGLTHGAVAGVQAVPPASSTPRAYSEAEHELLGDDAIGFIGFLESSGVLPPAMRETVIERAKASGDVPIDLEDLKVIVLMVFWNLGEEPDALILDELSFGAEPRPMH